VARIDDIDLRDWFAEHELALCPCCGQTTALPTPRGGFRVCLECGLVTSAGQRVSDLRSTLEDDRSSA
jgi:hypothetical protein